MNTDSDNTRCPDCNSLYAKYVSTDPGTTAMTTIEMYICVKCELERQRREKEAKGDE